MIELNSFICGDCMDYLPQIPDKYFDLAVVDPPYFSGPEKRNCYGRTVSPIGVKRYYKPSAEWNIPDENYFKELAYTGIHIRKVCHGQNGEVTGFATYAGNMRLFPEREFAKAAMRSALKLFLLCWRIKIMSIPGN